GTFCIYLKSSIISTVVLPTTEIIEPKYFSFIFFEFSGSKSLLFVILDESIGDFQLSIRIG
ncbi:hypothetical protein, partial [Streptococcus hyovaginalis]